jgi:Secretion system C-terminal sorting domain
MYKITTLLLILSIALLPLNSNATIVTSNGTGGGDWDAPETWLPAGVPACGDTITVVIGDVINIAVQQDYSACGSPMFITIFGTLDFPSNGPKLRLPCGSGVMIETGGWLTASASGGSGSANFLEICNTVVWRKADGDIPGPINFGTPAAEPVVLLEDIAVYPDKSTMRLAWNTTSETKNDYFTLERSENGVDFETVGEIAGGGTTNDQREYELYDDSPLMGTSYYRLKQTGYDGKFQYIGLKAVNFTEGDDGVCTLHVYPNPCVGSCTVNLKDCPLADNQVNVELYDAFGKKIVNRVTPKSKDKDISFHMNSSNNLAPGVYIVRSRTNGREQSSKVIVK